MASEREAVTGGHGLGNAAAMREALESVRRDMWDLMGSSSESLCEALALRINKTIRAALSAPPRQCDVGTAREQDARLWSYCAETRCGDTLCRNGNCSLEDIRMCALRWAQMPYEANEEGEVDDSNG